MLVDPGKIVRYRSIAFIRIVMRYLGDRMQLQRTYLWVVVATTLALPTILWQAWAQEFDTVISSQNRKAFTIADQIEDPAERRALTALFEQQAALEKARLADQFLSAYPHSWFLPQVYEIAAKAFIDLGDFKRALDYGRQSLKLLPENPLLLVPLANVEIQQSQLREAQASARLALQCLAEQARPLSIRSSDWPNIQRQLKASSYFALGRAIFTEALSLTAGRERTTLLTDAVQSLTTAGELNPADPEILYLLGLSLISKGEEETAALSFAHTYALGGPLQSKALEQLRLVHQKNGSAANTPDFQRFLEELVAKAQQRQDSHSAEVSASAKRPATSPPGYAGTDSCRQCHAEQHHNWQQTGMARMFRPYDPANVIGDFDSKESFYAGDEVQWAGTQLEVVPGKTRFVYARMLKERGRHYLEIRRSDDHWARYPVDYTIGSKWQQAYATRLPNGQVHVFPVQYNALHKRWLNFWKVIDPEGSERADVRTFEKFSSVTSYQANCAVCHTSQLRNTRGGGFEPDHLEFREPGINCEMCHGPSGRHANALRQGRAYEKRATEPPVDFTKISNREYLAICGQCHRQSAVRDAGPHGELNYWPSSSFYPPNKSRPYGEFSRKAFYKDGRFRETTFIVESLQRSACFQKGPVHCGHCHDVHGKDAAINLKSLRFQKDPDRMCKQCHTRFIQRPELHTRHSPASEASRCVSCHMPPIMNSLLFRARTHQIDDIPDPTMTQRFGSEESPNACLLCHQEKNVSWLKTALTAWKR